jgi:hypothetical protein
MIYEGKRHYRDNGHVASLWEELVVLESVANIRERHRLAVLHEEGGVRVAHAAD